MTAQQVVAMALKDKTRKQAQRMTDLAREGKEVPLWIWNMGGNELYKGCVLREWLEQTVAECLFNGGTENLPKEVRAAIREIERREEEKEGIDGSGMDA